MLLLPPQTSSFLKDSPSPHTGRLDRRGDNDFMTNVHTQYFTHCTLQRARGRPAAWGGVQVFVHICLWQVSESSFSPSRPVPFIQREPSHRRYARIKASRCKFTFLLPDFHSTLKEAHYPGYGFKTISLPMIKNRGTSWVANGWFLGRYRQQEKMTPFSWPCLGWSQVGFPQRHHSQGLSTREGCQISMSTEQWWCLPAHRPTLFAHRIDCKMIFVFLANSA